MLRKLGTAINRRSAATAAGGLPPLAPGFGSKVVGESLQQRQEWQNGVGVKREGSADVEGAPGAKRVRRVDVPLTGDAAARANQLLQEVRARAAAQGLAEDEFDVDQVGGFGRILLGTAWLLDLVLLGCLREGKALLTDHTTPKAGRLLSLLDSRSLCRSLSASNSSCYKCIHGTSKNKLMLLVTSP